MTINPLRRLLAVPLLLLAGVGSAAASEIRDGAGLFSAGAVREAQGILDRSERQHGHPVVIETIPTLDGRDQNDVAKENARRHNAAQVYVLISKKEHGFRMLERGGRFSGAQDVTIRDAFTSRFRNGDFDGGLVSGSEAIASAIASLPSGRAAVAAAPGRRAPVQNGRGGFGTIITIGLIVLAVLFGMRILGSLFGAGRGGYGAPGMRPGMGGPGYGGYGGGGGGGGFFSSLLGGIGGAMAGNWMYDQFRGRNHGGGYNSGDVGGMGGDPGAGQENADWGGGISGDWGGGGDAGGGGGDWGGGGGGGDWGGGGGGDWGGGGGGGGGGDW